MAGTPNNVFSTPDNTIGNLNGLFKQTYADKMKELIPDQVKLLNMVKFMEKSKQPGDLYHQPVVLGLEHGITFGAPGDDAFALNASIASAIKDAQVRGSPAVLRSVIGYSAASRAAQGGAQAFMDATKFVVGNMLRSMAKKLEIEMFYGYMGYGTVASIDGTNTIITIQTKEWAPGIWAGSENMPVQIRNAAGGTIRGGANILSVDFDARTITLDAAVTGVVNGDIIWHGGSTSSAYQKEFFGLHYILTNSGTIFNINAATYNLFKANSYDAQGGALSFAKLNQAAARSVEKGLETKITALVNPRGWANMLNDQASLRKYDGSYEKKKLENGTQALTFYSQNGEIEIIPSTYVKEGYAYLISIDDFARVGSTDITFKRPGAEGNFFRDLDGSAGYELRCMTDQALFCAAIGRQTIITNIVNQQ
jgi:hypothetical protein